MGYCFSEEDPCVFKNLINMAALYGHGYEFIGGIIGAIKSDTSQAYNSNIMNCLNFGNIRVDTDIGSGVLGGIVGLTSLKGKKLYIQNCGNYGHIYISYSNLRHGAGGIVGVLGDNTIIQNCINMGDFFGHDYSSIGNIVGKNEADKNAEVKNCYWLKGTYNDKAVGRSVGRITEIFVKESTSFSKDFSLSKPVVVSRQQIRKLIEAMNSFSDGEFEEWTVLDLDGGRIAKMDYLSKIPVIMGKNVFVKPNKNGYAFKRWYTDRRLKSRLYSKINDASSVETLYAKWEKSINVTFIFNANRVKKEININHFIEYPHVNLSHGHKAEWCTEGKEVCNPKTSNKDIELYLIQTPKEYTLSFDTNGGEEIKPKSIVFYDLIGELPVPDKEGCVFLGWFVDPELKYPFYAERMPDNDIVIHAKWDCSQNPKAAEIKALDCLNTSDFEEWVIMGFDEKEHVKNKKYLTKAPVFGNRKALKKLKDDCVFRGWYSDPGLKSAFNPETDDISEVAALYAKWGYYVKIVFISSLDAEKIERNIINDETIKYPDVEVSHGHKRSGAHEGRRCATR